MISQYSRVEECSARGRNQLSRNRKNINFLIGNFTFGPIRTHACTALCYNICAFGRNNDRNRWIDENIFCTTNPRVHRHGGGSTKHDTNIIDIRVNVASSCAGPTTRTCSVGPVTWFRKNKPLLYTNNNNVQYWTVQRSCLPTFHIRFLTRCCSYLR